MAARKFIVKAGEKRADITRDAATDTGNGVQLIADDAITTKELVIALELLRGKIVAIDS